MRVALAHKNGFVEDFKEAEEFGLYDIENGKISLAQNIAVRKDWYMSAAEFLAEQETDAIICRKIGRGARASFKEGGIEVYGGVEGRTEDCLKAFIDGSLSFDPLAGMV